MMRTVLVALAALLATPAIEPWGPVASPSGNAKATGDLLVTDLDRDAHVAKVRVRAKVAARTRCSWAVFRITSGDSKLAHKSYRTCARDKRLSVQFTRSGVSVVELKVCDGARTARPSTECLAAGTWKVLFTAFP
ncbi:hypothetical protein SAMN05444920_111189 [Nonomuraea solani]|uniref:Uncharacterized protein n=1 Tax=Nonomuraea solani TaxID=1144553 RepID=A0A1H6EJN8_9ACTN|nr:hypothetical protein [Nonomuraea solani]SEG98087.1 hypothetical protein SAMN05444920_111189 [Nonomuraea solani]